MKSSVRSVRMGRKMPLHLACNVPSFCAPDARGPTKEGKQRLGTSSCQWKHPLSEINTYCHTEKLAICAECVIDSHIDHQVERLSKAVDGFKEEVSTLTKEVCSSYFSFSFSFFLSQDSPLPLLSVNKLGQGT